MNKIFYDKSFEDFLYWQANDKKIFNKINNLIKDIERNGYNCKGKPEPLKGNFSGYWSVRIDKKNRLIFKINEGMLEIVECRNHYSDK